MTFHQAENRYAVRALETKGRTESESELGGILREANEP